LKAALQQDWRHEAKIGVRYAEAFVVVLSLQLLKRAGSTLRQAPETSFVAAASATCWSGKNENHEPRESRERFLQPTNGVVAMLLMTLMNVLIMQFQNATLLM
jgi:hypothetical protein